MQVTPRVTSDISHQGSGKFASFSASPRPGTIGEATGYATLDDAVLAMTDLTIGAARPAAGIYEVDGRFVGRELSTQVTFASGADWTGPWRLEQYPSDLAMFDGSITDSVTTRSAALRAVVDGAQHLRLDDIPVQD